MNPEPPSANPEPAIADILENLELQLEHAQAMAKHSPNVFLKASMNIAALEMFSVLNRFDTATLSKRLDEKPELFLQLINSQCTLTKTHLDQQKFEFKRKQAKAKQRERNQKLRAQKPILITTGTLAALDQTLHRGRPEKAGHSSPADAHNPEPQTGIPQPSVTANTGSTDTIKVVYQKPNPNHIVAAPRQSAADHSSIKHGRPATDDRRLVTDDPRLITEPCFQPAWSNAPPEPMVCCPS